MLYKQLYHFFHKLSSSIRLRQLSFVIDNFPGVKNVLDCLFNLLYIYGYKLDTKKNQFEVFLKYDSNGNPIVREVNWLIKGSVKYVIRIEDILLFQKKQLYSTGFVLTRKGILDFSECIKHNIGGILIVVLK